MKNIKKLGLYMLVLCASIEHAVLAVNIPEYNAPKKNPITKVEAESVKAEAKAQRDRLNQAEKEANASEKAEIERQRREIRDAELRADKTLNGIAIEAAKTAKEKATDNNKGSLERQIDDLQRVNQRIDAQIAENKAVEDNQKALAKMTGNALDNIALKTDKATQALFDEVENALKDVENNPETAIVSTGELLDKLKTDLDVLDTLENYVLKDAQDAERVAREAEVTVEPLSAILHDVAVQRDSLEIRSNELTTQAESELDLQKKNALQDKANNLEEVTFELNKIVDQIDALRSQEAVLQDKVIDAAFGEIVDAAKRPLDAAKAKLDFTKAEANSVSGVRASTDSVLSEISDMLLQTEKLSQSALLPDVVERITKEAVVDIDTAAGDIERYKVNKSASRRNVLKKDASNVLARKTQADGTLAKIQTEAIPVLKQLRSQLEAIKQRNVDALKNPTEFEKIRDEYNEQLEDQNIMSIKISFQSLY